MASLLDRGMQRVNFLAVTEDYRFLHKGWPLEKCWGEGGGDVGISRDFFCTLESRNLFFPPPCIRFFWSESVGIYFFINNKYPPPATDTEVNNCFGI